MMENDELIPVFVDESQQHLQLIEPDLLALEQNQGRVEKDTVNRIFRGIHSIKGASGFFGFQNIGKLSHIMENTLAYLRDGKLSPEPKIIDALLSGIDALRAMIDDLGASEDFDISHELSFLESLIEKTEENMVSVSLAGEADEKARIKGKGVHFHINERDVKRIISENWNLYAIKIYLNADLREKDRSPFLFIINMELFGEYIDSFLHVDQVSGLSDCLDNDLAFNFLVATAEKPEGVSRRLDIPEKRISKIDLSVFQTPEKAGPEPAQEEEKTPVPPEAPGESPQIPVEQAREEIKTEKIPAEEEEAKNKTDQTDEKAPAPVHTEDKVRVGVSYLNDLVNLAGELVLGRNQLMQTAFPLAKNTPGLAPVLQHISRVTSEMQEKIMQLRMQPMSLLFNKFHRLVRSLSRSHGKEVKFFTSGEDVELDKTIIEGLSDPLTHLIRNAVDHGIELPETREKAHKPRMGTITIKAHHQGGQVHLIVSDDGRGIDPDVVGKKALEKGLVTQEDISGMGEKEKVRLIFLPGFSTAREITDLSGRGVGMDVVMTNIEHLGGSVDIHTRKGKGTEIKLMLPLTLAIVSGLLIRAKEQNFILPEVDIDELVRVKPEEVNERIEVVQEAWVLRLRDMLLPLVDLNSVLGIGNGHPEREAKMDSLPELEQPMRILIIKSASSRFGLIVDAIISTEEIVVKPLPRYLKRMRVFSGVSILGNGTVSMILDVSGILKKADIRNLEAIRDEMLEDEEEKRDFEVQTLLVFDNKTEERFGIPLELISRIEKVPASAIERIKDKCFLQYQGVKLRLLFLEDHLPVTSPQRSEEDTIGILIPKQIKRPMGIVINQVLNTVEATVELDTSTIIAPGLFGSAVVDGRITLLPDMYRLFELAAPEWFQTETKTKKDKKEKYRILLVDDTPFFRMVESEYLVSAGYEVTTAENGAMAIQMLEEKSYDAMILDLVMPKMDGWEVIRAIRQDERFAGLPVMAVSSIADESMAKEGFAAGFNEWELKLDKTRLLEKLGRMLAA